MWAGLPEKTRDRVAGPPMRRHGNSISLIYAPAELITVVSGPRFAPRSPNMVSTMQSG